MAKFSIYFKQVQIPVNNYSFLLRDVPLSLKRVEIIFSILIFCSAIDFDITSDCKQRQQWATLERPCPKPEYFHLAIASIRNTSACLDVHEKSGKGNQWLTIASVFLAWVGVSCLVMVPVADPCVSFTQKWRPPYNCSGRQLKTAKS